MSDEERGGWAARVLAEPRRRRLASPRLKWIAALLSVALSAHCLGAGLMLDDLFHRLALLELAPELPGVPPGAPDLFRFMPGGGAFNDAAVERGTLPWWAGPDLRLAFWRPLASASHWLDYRLWPETVALMHLHSLAWMAGLVVLVARLYSRVGGAPAWVAGLATLLFALFSGHGVPSVWIANRGALMAAVCGVACLLAHDRGRRGGSGSFKAKLGAPLLFAAALLCGESGVAVLAYLSAYALCLEPARGPGPPGAEPGPSAKPEPSSRVQALLALWPYLLVTVAWRITYAALGYGAQGSAMYIDPLRAPFAFSLAALERGPLLVLGLLGGPPSQLTGLSPRPEQLLASLLAALLVAFIVWLLAPLLRASPSLRFWALGALGCCLPACATMPHDRLLTLAAVGSSMVVAEVLAAVAAGACGRGLARLGAAWLGLLFVIGPLTLVVDGLSMRLIAAPSIAAGEGLPAAAAGRTLMVVNTPEPLSMCAQLPFYLAAHAMPEPARLRCMGASEGPVEVRRPNASTLLLSADPSYLRGPNSRLLVNGDFARFAGFSRQLDELRVEVLRVDGEGRPQIVGFYFDTPLESAERVWVVWTGRRFEPFELPAVGETVRLEPHGLAEIADELLGL